MISEVVQSGVTIRQNTHEVFFFLDNFLKRILPYLYCIKHNKINLCHSKIPIRKYCNIKIHAFSETLSLIKKAIVFLKKWC